MTSGIQSKGVDLDSIFAAYASGTHPAATGIEVDGVDIATRYQPLPGTQAAATGIETNGADLNTLFSTTASGGGPGGIPISDGDTYSAIESVASGSSGSAWVEFTSTTSGWSITASPNLTVSPSGAPTSGALPTGATGVSYGTTEQSETNAPTITNGAPGNTAIGSSGPSILMEFSSARPGTGSSVTATYTFSIQYYNASGVGGAVSSATFVATVRAVG